jgi:hypothetical protein
MIVAIIITAILVSIIWNLLYHKNISFLENKAFGIGWKSGFDCGDIDGKKRTVAFFKEGKEFPTEELIEILEQEIAVQEAKNIIEHE